MKQLKRNFGLMMMTFAVIAFTATSCKKEKTDDAADSETITASNSEEGEAISNEAGNIADAAAKGISLAGKYSGIQEPLDALANCAVITNDTVSIPHVLTIDFGTGNCSGKDGKSRRGKIIVTYTGRYFEQGSIKEMTFNDFYRNDNKVEGTRTITNLGLNAAGHMCWSISAVNMKVTRPDGSFHSWNSERNREMLSGYDTADWTDDEYQVTGTATGTNIKGRTFSASITTPLHRKLSCQWIDRGVMEITRSNGSTRTIDFGSGTCDNEATITVTGRRGKTITKTIELK